MLFQNSNHVEKPLLDQLVGRTWELFGLDRKQHSSDSFRRRVSGNFLTFQQNVRVYAT